MVEEDGENTLTSGKRDCSQTGLVKNKKTNLNLKTEMAQQQSGSLIKNVEQKTN